MRILKSYLFILIVALTFQINCQESSIQVLSWNVFLRPSIMNDGQMNRVSEIGDYLEGSGADVLVLQEVFHRKARKALKKQLKSTYPYQTKKGPVSWLGIPSGVVFFSKMPIIKEKIVSFSLSRVQIAWLKKEPFWSLLKKTDKRYLFLVPTCRQDRICLEKKSEINKLIRSPKR